MEQRGFGSKHGLELKFFSSVFLKFNQIKSDKAGVKLQTMWHCKYSGIPESKVKFDEKYMKMSKYENNAFLYSVLSNVNLPAWWSKDTNLLEHLLSVYSSRQLLPKEKFFFQNYMKSFVKIKKFVRNFQHSILWHNHKNWNCL